jgi:hypothetical protein
MSGYLSPSDAAWVERVRSAATNPADPEPEPEPGFDTHTEATELDADEPSEMNPAVVDCGDDAQPAEPPSGGADSTGSVDEGSDAGVGVFTQ